MPSRPVPCALTPICRCRRIQSDRSDPKAWAAVARAPARPSGTLVKTRSLGTKSGAGSVDDHHDALPDVALPEVILPDSYLRDQTATGAALSPAVRGHSNRDGACGVGK